MNAYIELAAAKENLKQVNIDKAWIQCDSAITKIKRAIRLDTTEECGLNLPYMLETLQKRQTDLVNFDRYVKATISLIEIELE